jgi:NAD(P)-dependent dehydrogenase (short-subunit alcohol dehydrogenase family)
MTMSQNDLDMLRRIVDERLWGLIFVVRHAAPRMSQGSITVTSGSLSSRPRPGTAMLTAMLSAVEALALELALVRVNAVPQASWIPFCSTPPTGRSVTRLSGAGPPSRQKNAWARLMTNDYVIGEVVHVDGDRRFV